MIEVSEHKVDRRDQWCKRHKRLATHVTEKGKFVCDPMLGGILIPCDCIPKVVHDSIQNVKYRVQLPPDARWSEWRPITEPIQDKHILSFMYDRAVTWEESNEICKRIGA